MRMSVSGLLVFSGAGVVTAFLAGTALSQPADTGPVRYAMDAATMSGMAAMGSGQGGMGAMMDMMRGGPPSAVRLLTLHHLAQIKFIVSCGRFDPGISDNICVHSFHSEDNIS